MMGSPSWCSGWRTRSCNDIEVSALQRRVKARYRQLLYEDGQQRMDAATVKAAVAHFRTGDTAASETLRSLMQFSWPVVNLTRSAYLNCLFCFGSVSAHRVRESRVGRGRESTTLPHRKLPNVTRVRCLRGQINNR